MKDARYFSETAAKAQLAYATELFDIRTVAQAISYRAAEGYRDLRLSQLYPFDLSRSPPAQQLEDWLERNSYRYAWYPTSPILDPFWTSASEDYLELVIIW